MDNKGSVEHVTTGVPDISPGVTNAPGGLSAPGRRAWGPTTPGTHSCGIQEAVNAVAATGGGLVVVGAGSYLIENAVDVSSDTTIRFESARVSMAGDRPAFKVVGKSHVTFEGVVSFDGANHAARGVECLQSSDLVFHLRAQVKSMGNAMSFVHFKDCDYAVVSGAYYTTDSSVVHAEDTNHFEASGIHAQYSRYPGISPVRVQSSGHRGTTRNIHVHDVEVDGGGEGIFAKIGGLVNVSGDLPNTHIEGVLISNLKLENTDSKGLTDGLDIGRCDYITIHNVVGRRVNSLIALSNAARATISQVIGINCAAQSVAVGDPSGMTEDVSDVVVDSCMAFDCGTNTNYPPYARAGIAVLVTPGHHTRRVRIQNCLSRDSGAGIQTYGLAVYDGAEDILVSGCLFGGTLGPVSNRANPSAGIVIRP